MKKRLLSALLAVCLVVGMVPATLLTANAAGAVTNITVNQVNVTLPSGMPTAGTEVSLAVSADVSNLMKGNEAAPDAATHLKATVTATPASGCATQGSDGKWYWKAGVVPAISVKVELYSTSGAYRFSWGSGITEANGKLNDNSASWISTFSGGTINARFDANVDGKSDTTNDAIAFLDAAQLNYSYTDAVNTTPTAYATAGTASGTSEVDTGTIINVVKGQKATLSVNSLDDKGLKGGAISVVPNSYPPDFITVSGSGSITVTGKQATTNPVSFTLKVAKSGNCADRFFTFTVNVLDSAKGFTLASSASSVEYSEDSSTAPILKATALNASNDVVDVTSSCEFETSNPEVLTVSGSTLTIVGAGTATITAKYKDGGKVIGTSSVTITVTKKKITVPVAASKVYTYADQDNLTFQWTTAPAATDLTGGLVLLQLDGIKKNAVSELTFVPAGNHTITLSLIKPENYQWADGTTADKTYTWAVAPKSLSSASVKGNVTGGPFYYSGDPYTVGSDTSPITLALTDSVTGAPAPSLGADYTVSGYSNNVYAGDSTASVTITGMGNYTGSQTYTYSISPRPTATLDISTAVAKTAGSSLDLRTLLFSSDIPGFDYSKLTSSGFIWTLTDTTKGTLKDSTLTINSKLGAGAKITVTGQYTGGTYDANGDGVAEYSSVTMGSKTIEITVAGKTQTVNLPTPASGLVYNGKEQVGVSSGSGYLLDDKTAPLTPVGNKAANGKATNAGDHYTVVSLDQTKAPVGTTLVWPDGTTAPKAVSWSIAKAKPTVTVSFTPVIQAEKKLNDSEVALSVHTAYGVDGEDLTSSGTATWDGATNGPSIVQHASYGWTWKTTNPNYENVTGSAVIWGTTTGGGTASGGTSTGGSTGGGSTTGDITKSTVPNPDGSTTEIESNKKTGVVTYTTTGPNGTSSKVVYTNGVLTSATAYSPASGAVAYVPLSSVSWGSVITRNGAADMHSGLPAGDLRGMWVTLPSGNSTLGVTNYTRSFPDVSGSDWFSAAATLAASRNLIQGINGYYTPNGTLNHGQIWTMLSRYVGAVNLTQSSGNSWYVQPQAWAYNNGISSVAAYTDNATREDVALMMYNTYLRYSGKGAPNVNTSGLSAVSDYASVSYDARNAVAWCIQTGIIKGYPNGTFQPHGEIKRSEAAQMVARLMYVMEGLPIPGAFAN